MNAERLTRREREFAEKNHNTIYAFLYNRKLSSEEYYEVVLLDYIRAVRRYNREKRLQKFSFCTIAWKCMDTACCNYWRKKNRKREHEVMSLDAEPEGDTYGLRDTLEDTKSGYEFEKVEMQDCLKELLHCLTDEQIHQLELLYEGYSYKEASLKARVYERKEQKANREVIERAAAAVFR